MGYGFPPFFGRLAGRRAEPDLAGLSPIPRPGAGDARYDFADYGGPTMTATATTFPFRHPRSVLVMILTLSLLTPVVRAADADSDAAKPAGADAATKFIRFTEDGKGGGTLDAAIVTYRDKQGRRVDLLSAFHVGEAAYYADLSKAFTQYDALLYELVKPKDAAAPKPGMKRTATAVGGVQRLLKDTLELEFQLDAIDYSPKNFVHADLDYETFEEKQAERGESMFTLMMRSMMAEMNRQAAGAGGRPITLIDLLVAMTSPDSARQYKLLLARQFEDIDAQMAGLEGPDGSVILTERNKAAVKVLKEQLVAGKKNLGIFYGAAHMTGIEQTLTAEMGFKREAVRYLVAWDMTQAAADAAAKKKAAATRPATKERAPVERPVEPAPVE
jgi:hypothetical protein